MHRRAYLSAIGLAATAGCLGFGGDGADPGSSASPNDDGHYSVGGGRRDRFTGTPRWDSRADDWGEAFADFGRVDSVVTPGTIGTATRVLWDEDHGHFGCDVRQYLADVEGAAPPVLEAWLQHYLYYPSEATDSIHYWDWGPDARHAKFSIGWSGRYGGYGSAGRSDPQAWSARLNASRLDSSEVWGPGPHIGDRGFVGLEYYVYHQTKGGSAQDGDYGDTFAWDYQERDEDRHRIGVIDPDTWYRIDQYAKVNSGRNEDGILIAWVDGEVAFDHRDWQFVDRETYPDHGILNVLLNCYMGGSETIYKDMYNYHDRARLSIDGALARPSQLERPRKGFPWASTGPRS